MASTPPCRSNICPIRGRHQEAPQVAIMAKARLLLPPPLPQRQCHHPCHPQCPRISTTSMALTTSLALLLPRSLSRCIPVLLFWTALLALRRRPRSLLPTPSSGQTVHRMRLLDPRGSVPNPDTPTILLLPTARRSQTASRRRLRVMGVHLSTRKAVSSVPLRPGKRRMARRTVARRRPHRLMVTTL
jgi:hypothetical protein